MLHATLHQSHPEIVKRLRRAEGHLRGGVAMIEEGRPCPVGVDGPTALNVLILGRTTNPWKGRPVEFKRVSIDISKHVFTIHGVDDRERPILRRELRRAQAEALFAEMASTEIALEACAGSHQ